VARKRRRKRLFPQIDRGFIRRINELIPPRFSESITARSDKLAIAILTRVFGADWRDRHVNTVNKNAFLGVRDDDIKVRETRRMRRITLAEMIYNLQRVKGFNCCLEQLADGEVESTYAALEIARMLVTTAIDQKLSFRIVRPSGIKRRDYDLSIRTGDGVRMPAETKCKQEETAITLSTIEASLSQAKKQLPKCAPGIVFIKVPRWWLDDEKFVQEMRKLAERSMARSPWIVSVKYYTAHVVFEKDADGAEITGEVVAFREHSNDNHKFRKYRGRNWHVFPATGPVAPPKQINYNGLPSTWYRLFFGTTVG
jgi:hypothetical protein